MRSPLHVSPVVADLGQALSIQYNNLVYEMKESGQDVITLSLGEAFFDIPVPTFEGLTGTDLHHYSHSRGLPELRQLLAKYYEIRFGVAVDPDHEAVITAGSKAAIYMVLLAVLEPGDEVIIPEPFWLSYPAQVRLCGGTPVMIPHKLSVFDLERFVTSRSRVVVINNPNNPTGRVYSRAELEFLHTMAAKHGLLLLVDEAYNEFVPNSADFISASSLDPGMDHTVTVNSMSKNYGISGWRIGYLLANRRLVDEVLKIQQHLVTCAPTILSTYLAGRFDQLLNITRPQIQQIVGLRNRAEGRLAEHGIPALPGSATFYLFASIGGSRLTSAEFADELLRESAVSVVPGIGYGESCDRFIRISVGSESEERITRGIVAIRDLIHTSGGSG
ncbi:pyridoxal phosphate-dependent aminotransferase [Streptomyces uncialis]|uniref:pyridoxal phosphate-dependent aminotransferase n=1 Tax=Streptomyces uncialis TaxID=1048205 RepID=UPI0036587A4A